MNAQLRRREFITLLGGAAAIAWPLTARAQQGERMRRIGVIMSLAADDRETQARHAAFLQGLQQLGWTDGPQRADRVSRGDRCRPYSPICGRIGRAGTGCHPVQWHGGRRTTATGDPHSADRIRAGRGSGRRRLCREPVAARWQRYRVFRVRIQHERKVAGTDQRNCAQRKASGSYSRSLYIGWTRPVRRDPGRGAFVRR